MSTPSRKEGDAPGGGGVRERLHAVLMAGGPGARFWPRSRKGRPKPLLSVGAGGPLIARTAALLADLVPPARRWVVCGAPYAAEMAAALPDLDPAHVLGEPCRRETAACVALAAEVVGAVAPDAILLVLPTDHQIAPADAFRRTLLRAAEVAATTGAIVTLGLVPDRPSTAFGYIERGEALAAGAGPGPAIPAYRALAFVEKPDAARAKDLVARGYRWNAGIFVLGVATAREACRRYLPGHASALEGVGAAFRDGGPSASFRERLGRAFEALTPISFDHGVMEKAAAAGGVAVVDAPIAWKDVGSWPEAASLLAADPAGNAVDGRHVGIDTAGCVVACDPGHLVATLGVRDLIVVQAGNAVLVCDRSRAGEVKDLVLALGRAGLEEHL